MKIPVKFAQFPYDNLNYKKKTKHKTTVSVANLPPPHHTIVSLEETITIITHPSGLESRPADDLECDRIGRAAKTSSNQFQLSVPYALLLLLDKFECETTQILNIESSHCISEQGNKLNNFDKNLQNLNKIQFINVANLFEDNSSNFLPFGSDEYVIKQFSGHPAIAPSKLKDYKIDGLAREIVREIDEQFPINNILHEPDLCELRQNCCEPDLNESLQNNIDAVSIVQESIENEPTSFDTPCNSNGTMQTSACHDMLSPEVIMNEQTTYQHEASCCFSDEEQTNILDCLQNLNIPKLKISSCNFQSTYAEICLVDEGCGLNEDVIAKELQVCLGIDSMEQIRIVTLNRHPKFIETSISPGCDVITDENGKNQCSMAGAFVGVFKKGAHVLLIGHCHVTGEKIFSLTTNKTLEEFGVVVVQQTCNSANGYQDAALAKILKNVKYSSELQIQGKTIHLHHRPLTMDALVDDDVHKFCPDNNQKAGIIISKNYTLYDYIQGKPMKMYSKCIAIVNKEGNQKPFHKKGESGILLTTCKPDNCGFVYGVGILFGLSFLEKTDDGRGEYLSYAIPLSRCIENLQTSEYCSRKNILFASYVTGLAILLGYINHKVHKLNL